LRYFYYQYFDWYKRNIFNGLGAGVRQTLSAADLVNYQVVFPPIDEQDQIVRFLDWKTSEMNRVIHAKNQEIKRLKELRVVAINTAVTRGVKGYPLKKSGTSWLNEIPENWNMLPSKRLFFLRKDKAKPEDEQLTASQKYGVVPQQWFMEQEGRRVTVVFTGEDILKHVEKGDFVISMRSFQGGIEYSNYSGKISSAYVMLIPNHEYVYDRFFKWFLKSPEYIKALRGTSDLVRDGQALRYANFAKIDLPVVPMEEQIAIADYLDNICKRIDDAIEKVKKEIALIQELKTRTIYDAVTGKIDVRDVYIPAYEDVEDETSDEDSEEVETVDEEVDE
jgi:type I restriction enzyme S subunit